MSNGKLKKKILYFLYKGDYNNFIFYLKKYQKNKNYRDIYDFSVEEILNGENLNINSSRIHIPYFLRVNNMYIDGSGVISKKQKSSFKPIITIDIRR